MSSVAVPSGTDPVRSLLRAAHLLTADDLAASVQAHAPLLGASELVIYLTDYAQVTLRPLPGHGVPARDDVSIEGSMAGRAFTRLQTISSVTTPGGHRLWVPLVDGVERLGVVEVLHEAAPTQADLDELTVFVMLIATLVVDKSAYSDVFARVRRRRSLTLAAEIQWKLLPPLTFGTSRLVITGALEPAYDIGGDTFDYAVNGSIVDLMILDSVGHGLPASILAGLAIGAYRHGRRSGVGLPEIAAEMNEAIAGQIGRSQFATAVLARLDLDTGSLSWVNAGHPPPLVLRGTTLLELETTPDRPLGLQVTRVTVAETRLEPGDRLLLTTDGVTEARSPTGEFFGEQRLADFISSAGAAGVPVPETMRRLVRHVLEHQTGRLQDDASIVLLEWRTGDAAVRADPLAPVP